MIIKETRIKHSPEFKAEALILVGKVGVSVAERQFSLHESQIYGWWKNSKKDINTSEREQELATEVAMTIRLQKALSSYLKGKELSKRSVLPEKKFVWISSNI